MWFIGVEVEQSETSAPPPKKKILDPPLMLPIRVWLLRVSILQ